MTEKKFNKPSENPASKNIAPKNIERRDLLKAAALAGVSGTLAEHFPLKAASGGKVSQTIAKENKKKGTRDWQLTFVRPDNKENNRTKHIEGYCSEQSVKAGQSIAFHISTNVPASVKIELFRLGYYGGDGGRKISTLGPFPVKPQPESEIGENRIRECQWEKTTEITIPEDWVSGVYLGKLSCDAHRFQSYVIFIVRDDRKADVMFQCSDNTWQAYNKWPHNYSLYDSDPPRNSLNGTTRVSFDRPYAKYPQVVDHALSFGSGEFLLWEFPLAFWLEKHGYDVTYCSNLDTHNDPDGLMRVKTFLSVGHDEYWSLEMYQNMMKAVQGGLNVAFLSGNTCCFVAPYVSNSKGQPNRAFNRAGRYGGLSEAEIKNKFGPFDLDGPNERNLIGARTINPFNGSDNWTVSQPKHWILKGTGMKKGDSIPGLVGWEFHGDPAPIKGLEVVAEGHSTNSAGKQAHWTATVYPGPKGNWVFNASTIFWSMGLSNPPGFILPFVHHGRPHGVDPRVQRITANFLTQCKVFPG